MRVMRGLGKCLVPLGLLLGLLLVGDADAKTQLPIKPSLQEALKLLDTASGPHLPEAVLAVRAALGDLDNVNLFPPGTAPGEMVVPSVPLAPVPKLNPIEQFILEPPGGLYDLQNRYKVKLALKHLQAAQKLLNSQISSLGAGDQRRADRWALQNVEAAITDVQEFLRIPFIF